MASLDTRKWAVAQSIQYFSANIGRFMDAENIIKYADELANYIADGSKPVRTGGG